MKITELHVEGFRSLKDVTWKPGDLNIVIGANASGKSNLLILLEMVSKSAQSKFTRHVLSLGGIAEVRTYDYDGDIKVSLKIYDENQRVRDHEIEFAKLRLKESDWQQYGKWDEFSYQLTIIGGNNSFSIIGEFLQVIQKKEINNLVPNVVSFYNVPLPETLLSEIGDNKNEEKTLKYFRSYFSEWHLHTDFRTDKKAPVKQSILTSTDENVMNDGENFVNVLHTLYSQNKRFKEGINDAMRAAFGDAYEGVVIGPEASGKVELKIHWKPHSRPTPAFSLSDGTLRFLYLLTILSQPEPPSLIAIDEPETGLHPSMLPIIAEYAREASRRTQVIFTTHSPEFLSAFQQVCQPTVTVCSLENGETKLSVLDGEELTYWLKKYQLGELFTSGELDNMK